MVYVYSQLGCYDNTDMFCDACNRYVIIVMFFYYTKAKQSNVGLAVELRPIWHALLLLRVKAQTSIS